MKNLLTTELQKLDNRNFIFWILGFVSFLWLILRSGTNPRRLTYPCQQAAYPLASAWFISISGILAILIIKKNKKYLSYITITALILFALYYIAVNNYTTFIHSPAKLLVMPVWNSGENTISEVFIYDNIPETSPSLNAANASIPNEHLVDAGIDSLFRIMEIKGTYFHKTIVQPTGIVGKDDIVIIKGNFQWRSRLSTNTDRIKGVISQILNHPEGFNGEIIICDNGSRQNQPESYFCGITEYANNSHDPLQSILDVINTFKAKGYSVDYFEWDNLNNDLVAEYDENNINNGYVYNSTTKVNYPKFKTPGNNYVSLKRGIWNTQNQSYNKDLLTIINMPVLKAHGMVNATIAVKNWIGIMNNTKTSEWYGSYEQFHENYCFNAYALPARVLCEIWPKLNIVDATWVAPTSNYNYDQTFINQNTILASTDPFAVSWYSAKYILQNLVPDGNADQVNPDNEWGNYAKTLNNWYNYVINNSSHTITKDNSKISVYGKEVITNTNNVDKINYKSELIVYPNPTTSNNIYIKTEQAGKIKIINSEGKTIYEQEIKNKETQIKAQLSKGVYLIQLITGNKTINCEKLIIN